MAVKPAIIPNLRYKDAPAAIDFLCNAFGFERHGVYADDEDPKIIHHAQLTDRGNMVMVSTAIDNDHVVKAGMRTVIEAGAATMGLYITVDDVDGHAARARSAGAEILSDPADQDYGGRVYTCRDPERNIWSFGSYDPFA